MNLIYIKATNFGSFRQLDLDFDNLGLILVDGETGSGKSTLLDAVAWGIFGETPKDLNVSDIPSWGVKEPTLVEIALTIKNGSTIIISRIRGKASQNDLYIDVEGKKVRGKDILETQKLINEMLGFDYSSFTIASYLTPTSVSSKFFESKATERRELFERLTDLSMPVKLTDNINLHLKQLKKELDTLNLEHKTTLVKLERADHLKLQLEQEHRSFETTRADTISNLMKASNNFDIEREEKIEAAKNKHQWWENNNHSEIIKAEEAYETINHKLKGQAAPKCEVCGSINEDIVRMQSKLTQLEMKLKELRTKENPYPTTVEIVNNYRELIESEKTKVNPFLVLQQNNIVSIAQFKTSLEQLKKQIQEFNELDLQLNQLLRVTGILRSKIISKITEECESETNRLLEEYFDAEFKIRIEVGNKDTLEVMILKDSNECSYKQLSKGQRCLLRLCFCVSLMAIAENNIGVAFNTIFFDEALDGLDSALKIKSHSLFLEIEKNKTNVFLVEHSPDIKPLILNRLCVKINNIGSSMIEIN